MKNCFPIDYCKKTNEYIQLANHQANIVSNKLSEICIIIFPVPPISNTCFIILTLFKHPKINQNEGMFSTLA
jgi:hypothetical protein